MMQSAEQGHFGNLADAMNNSIDRRIVAQREVSPHLIVQANIAKPMQHKQRIHKVLEDANVKLASVVSDVLGESGRRMLNALIAGESDAN